MNVRNHTVCWNLLVKATTATEKVAVEKVAVYIFFFFFLFFLQWPSESPDRHWLWRGLKKVEHNSVNSIEWLIVSYKRQLHKIIVLKVIVLSVLRFSTHCFVILAQLLLSDDTV